MFGEIHACGYTRSTPRLFCTGSRLSQYKNSRSSMVCLRVLFGTSWNCNYIFTPLSLLMLVLLPFLSWTTFWGVRPVTKLNWVPRLILQGRFCTTRGFTKKVLITFGKRRYIPFETPFMCTSWHNPPWAVLGVVSCPLLSVLES